MTERDTLREAIKEYRMTKELKYAIEMHDRNGVWTDNLGMGREEFDTVKDAREAIRSLHDLDDEAFHETARIVTHDGTEEIEVIPF